MTDTKFNIEDYFKSLFKNFKSEPSEKLWDNINSALDNSEDEKEVSKIAGLFEFFRVSPSARVWMNIQKMLDFGLISGAGTSSVFSRFFNFHHTFSTLLILISILITSIIPSVNNSSHLAIEKNNFNDISNLKKSRLSTPSMSKLAEHPVNKTTTIVTINNSQFRQTAIQKHNNTLSNTESRIQAEYNGSNFSNNVNKNESKSQINQLTDNYNIENHQVKPSSNINTLGNPAKMEIFSPIKQIFINKHVTIYDDNAIIIRQQNLDNYFSIRDTFYHDWVKKFIFRKIYNWYIGLSIWPKYSNNPSITSSAVYHYPLNKFDETEALNPGYKVGFSFGHYYNNWIIETGLNYELRKTTADYDLTFVRTDSLFTKKHDSVGFIYNPVTNKHITIYRNRFDTTISTKKMNFNASSDNLLNIFEIPLVVGYRVQYKKSSFIFKTGVIAAIIVSKQLSLNPAYGVDLENIPYPELNPIQWSAAFTGEYNYALFDRFNLIASLTTQYPFNSIYKNYPIQRTFYSWGLKVGINYNFGEEKTK